MFSPLDRASLASFGDDDLRLLLRAITMIAFYDPDVPLSEDARLIVDVMKRRGVVRQSDRTHFLQLLIGARQFDEAKRYLLASGGNDKIVPQLVNDPGTRSAGDRSILVLTSEGEGLEWRTIPGSDVEVIVVSSPLCAFSRRASASLEADPEMRDVMARRAHWIMPVEGDLHVDSVRAWNASHPASQMAYAYKENAWPFVDSWETPTFYFLRSGKVVAKHVGWRSDADRKVVKAYLADLGLITER